MNNLNAERVKCKCYQVDTKQLTCLTHISHCYDFDLIWGVIFDNKLDSFCLFEVNTRFVSNNII